MTNAERQKLRAANAALHRRRVEHAARINAPQRAARITQQAAPWPLFVFALATAFVCAVGPVIAAIILKG